MSGRKRSKLADLERLRELLSLKGSSFSTMNTDWENDPLPGSEAEVDDFIRRRTKLWRKSWVLPILERLIKAERRKVEKRRRREANKRRGAGA